LRYRCLINMLSSLSVAAQVGGNQAPSNVNNITAVLFLWTILPGYAAASYMPTIVLERPLYVRCVHTC
jgi:ATP-binding cassette subfamily G (WHITE) protein 2